jgi:phage shock protein PspC (stress-responsive transcriptional regulator)
LNIERAKRDRLLLGVCGGIAHSFGWNSNLVRLLTVVLGIFIPGPNVIVLAGYIILGLILPVSEEF